MDSKTVTMTIRKKFSNAIETPSAGAFFKRLRSHTSAEWTRINQEHVVRLFERMAEKVPAYKKFLRSQGIKRKNISTLEDFSTVPSISKKNYLHPSDFNELFWRGSLLSPHILTSTSGSTGKPTYFARSHEVDERSSLIHELIYRTSSLKLNSSTLVIVCFGMGVWIGGLITYQAFELMSRRGYPISILTPGINKSEILKTLRDLAPQYDQIILAGYPPFLKDVIDEAIEEGISFEKHRVMLLFAAEAFTERFRDHVAEKVGIKNILTDAINIYGSADIGTMAFETPLSILIRRLATNNEKLFTDLFRGTTKTPTLAQYIPDSVSFEAPNGEILVTGDSSIPLARYSIGDHGGVYTFREMVDRCKTHKIDIMKEARTAGISKQVLELPFVYVYERIDLATTLYGLQIYPETIKEVLLDRRFHTTLTGKLTLTTKYDHNEDQYLEINIELKPQKEAGKIFVSELQSEILKNLREKNSEFHELSDFMGKRAEPRLVFWQYEDPLYFKPGIKQPWVIRPAA
ncbi:phenylacetate--CoA ligase family protein [Patescibacteria group bacterium]|nr:phenylacetate--CoA ligase family protein [Patescibacteria group bacterium]